MARVGPPIASLGRHHVTAGRGVIGGWGVDAGAGVFRAVAHDAGGGGICQEKVWRDLNNLRLFNIIK